MDQRHRDYADYYRVRAERAAASASARRRAPLERDRADAIAAAAGLEQLELIEREGRFGDRIAAATAADQAEARRDGHRALDEHVRAAVEHDILTAVEGLDDVTAVMSAVADIEADGRLRITLDEFHRVFADAIDLLEELECAERADLPAEHEAWRAEYVADLESAIADSHARATEQARALDPAWTFDPGIATEPRHRRMIPLDDDAASRHLERYLRIVEAVR